MKRFFKIVLLLLGVLVVGAVAAGVIAHEPLPTGPAGPAADALARKMEAAVNKDAWTKTGAVNWSFHDRHHFLWDRARGLVRVEFGDHKVFLRPGDQTGRAWKGDQEVQGDKANALLGKAYKYFINDSYWLNPVVKLFDPGVSRSLVKLDDGSEALLVTYASGGVTPGDSYLWMVDENGLPTAWKMWVKIIPVGGIGNTWEGWVDLPTGARISTVHRVLGRPLEFIRNLKAAATLAELEPGPDPFTVLF